jgi:SAM-dependent methyltransferase
VSDPDLQRVYAQRFSDDDARRKDAIWKVIAAHLQRWVAEDATVLDIACDRGHFVNNVRAAHKVGSDVRDVSAFLDPGVRFVHAQGLSLLEHLDAASFDVVFMSNYLEHLPSGDAVIEQMRIARELIRPGGRVIVLQPNVRLCGGAYWDFIDHKTPITERSLVEAAELIGLRTERLITRFLPFTTKSRLPQHPVLVRAFLATPPARMLLGKQTLYVGRR